MERTEKSRRKSLSEVVERVEVVFIIEIQRKEGLQYSAEDNHYMRCVDKKEGIIFHHSSILIQKLTFVKEVASSINLHKIIISSIYQPITIIMYAVTPKDSVYSIEPWDDDPTALPSSFLPKQQFSKTLFCPNSSTGKAFPLQVGTNSIYLIKNQQENDESPVRKRLRFHCTAQNSPRMAAQKQEKGPLKRALSDRLTKSHQMTKTKKKISEEETSHAKFLETKSTFIEFKMIKKTRRPSINMEDTAKDSKSNLQKKYEKSTVGKGLKKESGKEEGLQENFVRRKLKTQKANLQSVRNLLTSMEDPEKDHSKGQTPLPLPLTHQNPSQSSKDIQAFKEDAGGQKLRLQLLMQRKLFLMRNKWHKNLQNSSIPASRPIK